MRLCLKYSRLFFSGHGVWAKYMTSRTSSGLGGLINNNNKAVLWWCREWFVMRMTWSCSVMSSRRHTASKLVIRSLRAKSSSLTDWHPPTTTITTTTILILVVAFTVSLSTVVVLVVVYCLFTSMLFWHFENRKSTYKTFYFKCIYYLLATSSSHKHMDYGTNNIDQRISKLFTVNVTCLM